MRPRLLLTSAALSVVLGATGFANAQTNSDSSRDQTLQRQDHRQEQRKAPSQTTGQSSGQSQMTPAQTQNTPADARSQRQPSPNQSTTGQSDTQSNQPGANPPSTAQTNRPAASPQNNQPASAQTNQPTTSPNTAQSPTSPNTAQPSTASGNQMNQPATTAQQPAANAGTTNQAAAPQGQAPTRLSASLQTEQKTRLNQAVASLDVRPISNVNFSVSVGTAVPQTVSLRPLPDTIVSVIPQYRGYDFFVVRDEIVIVEPSSHRIVDVIERSGGPARAQATTSERKLNLSSQQREVIRKHSAQRTTTTTTTGSAPRSSRTMTIGEEAPDTVVIESFPEEVYRDVPEIRSYRYIQGDRGVYIVDPQSRRVIEDIE